MSPELQLLYESVVSCPNGPSLCPNTVNAPAQDSPPRGFFTRALPGQVKILFVAKNPGHSLLSEQGMYRGQSPSEIVDRHLRFIAAMLDAPAKKEDMRSLVFHRNLRRYAAYFLDLDESQIWGQCAYTVSPRRTHLRRGQSGE